VLVSLPNTKHIKESKAKQKSSNSTKSWGDHMTEN
jgi:hypothetical protein